MRYLIIILCIIAGISVLTFLMLWPEAEPDEQDVVLTVNNTQITRDMIAQIARQHPSHHLSKQDLLHTVAVERILIKEAQRQSIDREPAFREAIKNFYEQSLIKILLERQHHITKDNVLEKEIDDFLGNYGKTFTFSIVQGKGDSITPNLDWSKGKSSTELFDNLSATIQPVLVNLQPGDIRPVFDTGNEWFAIKIEEVTGTTNLNISMSRDTIRNIIYNHKRHQRINSWINRLIEDADISIKKD